MIFLKPEPVQLDDLTAEAQEALYHEIKGYIDAGGILTDSLWQRMDPAERVMYRFVQNGGAEKEFDVLNGLMDRIEAKAAGTVEP